MIRVVFEDEALLVIDKPPGLVVDRSNTQTEDTLEDILKNQFQIKLERGGLVHRLDKDTSGLLVVAKTQTALDNLQAQFKERKTKKEYLALVHGLVEQSGVVDAAIARNPRNREKFTVSLQGVPLEAPLEAREAVTEYEPLERLQFTDDRLQEIFANFNKIQMRKLSTVHYNLFTLVKCLPKTGRTHQIRVHLKYIGLPIVADQKYGGRKMTRLDNRWCPRMFLHAAKLDFTHPVSGEQISLESPLPEDLKKTLNLLTNG